MKLNSLNPLRILKLLTLAALLCCCTNEYDKYEISTRGISEKLVTFAVRVPGTDAPQTYALTSSDENEVTQIAVLLFDASGYTYAPLWCTNVTSSGPNGNIKTFSVKVPVGTYDLMVLANANQSLSNALAAATNPIVIGDSKATVIGKLLQQGSGKWNATVGTAGYIPTPMWGEITNTTVNNTLTTPLTTPLVRMLAKIDVTLAATAKSNFKLQSVRLYNYYDKGQVVPTGSTWPAVNPSVPALAAKPTTPDTTPLVYATTTPDEACEGKIYTFEAGAGSSSTHLANTCLVVGGIYIGDVNETFYRIDFTQDIAGAKTYLNLLRNHSYAVNIAKVSGSGLPSAKEAFESRVAHIQATIVGWNDGRMSDVVSDGQYKLGVSRGELTLTREARTALSTDNMLSITTNYPTGWTVEKIVNGSGDDIDFTTNPTSGWLSLTPRTGATGTTVDAKVLVTAITKGSTRMGFIYLRAGRLTYVVTVYQTANEALSFTVRDGATNTIDVTDLVFAAGVGVQPAAQSIQLSWMPVNQWINVGTAALGGAAFSYAPGSHTPGVGSETSYADASGQKLLTIQPTAITAAELATDPFLEKISKVDFTVYNGSSYLAKSLFLRQLVYNLVVNQSTSYYPLDGSQYTLHVRSNANWKIKSITESTGAGSLLDLIDSDNLRVTTTGGANTDTGTPVTFTVANNISLNGTLTIVFESMDSPQRFNEVTVAINLSTEYYPKQHNGWAGSNIYWDGSKMTFDDVGVQTNKNYQGLYFQWGSLWGIAPNGAYGSAWATSHTVYRSTSGGHTSTTNNSWNTFPRVNDENIVNTSPSGETVRDRAYLYEISNGATGVGDICKYLTEQAGGTLHGKKWRMPTSMEFETASGGYTLSGSSWLVVTSTDVRGQYQNPNAPGYTKLNKGNPFFPASGYRSYTNGQLYDVGYVGYYWSSTHNDTSGYCMTFGNGVVGPGNNSYRSNGFSVRCVVE